MYVIVVVPADIPVTNPFVEPIVAIEGVLLVHDRPPPVLLDWDAVAPTHIAEDPVIADGTALTVKLIVFIQPDTL